MAFDPEAIAAAAASAAAKSASGFSGTDTLAPDGSVIVSDGVTPPADLTTKYMGLTLRNPLVASAGPLTQSLEGFRALANGGVGAIVMHSLFEEQVRFEQERATRIEEAHAHSFAEALTYFPTEASGAGGEIRHYLELLEAGVKAVDVPIIASLNGSARGTWLETAKRMQDAGAAAIELNIYYVPGDIYTGSYEVEERYLAMLETAKMAVDIPVALKVGPYISSFGELIRRLDNLEADAFVLFNRFLQPDVDVDRVEVVPGFGLSTPWEGSLARTWISALHGQVDASLAGSTGVDDADDVIKYLLAGADVVMTTSALLRHGPTYAQTMLTGLQRFLARKQLTLAQLRGMLAIPDDVSVDRYERSGYVAALEKAKRKYGM